METLKISCPKCGTSFDLSEAVQEDMLRNLQEQAQQAANQKMALDMKDLQAQLKEKSDQLTKAQNMELELRKQKRELDEKMEGMDLEIERKLDKERKQIAQDSREKADEENRLKFMEQQQTMNELKKQLDDAKRKIDQGSQQTQGEVAELDLEDALKCSFPFDEIKPVGKGVRGADIHQRVQSTNGQYCGTIIWESKNAKNWSDRWLSKIKEDQLAAKADIAVIVSTVLPEDVSHFSCVDGTWVTGFPFALSLAMALRETLMGVAHARRSLQGKDDKIELLYRYLSGQEFKQRIEMIVTTFITMKNELDGEKRSMAKLWSQREKSIEKVIGNVAGMYGDLQGIIGAALPTIQTLELPAPSEDI